MLKKIVGALALLAMGISTSGCVLAAAVGAGAVAADEISEKDGKFDPLEEAYDGDDSTTPLIDEDDE
ncbi:MAG: hypothetical protein AAFX54_02360 [Pseudomonadota bacterium]